MWWEVFPKLWAVWPSAAVQQQRLVEQTARRKLFSMTFLFHSFIVKHVCIYKKSQLKPTEDN